MFGASFGLETALWYAPPGMEPVETPSYRRSNAFPVVREECLAVRNAVGLMEISGFGKYEISGPGTADWLDRLLASRLPKPGRMTLAPMLNPRGTIMGDFSLARLAPERFLMVGSGAAEIFHMRWFERQGIPSTVQLRPMAGTLTGFMIAGPQARTLLARLVREDVRNAAFPFFAVREMVVGMAPCIVARASYTGDLGYEIWTTPDYQLALHEALVEAGADLGLRHFGNRALMSLRLEKGYGAFLREFRPDYTPMESGLDRFVAYDKPDFIGREAALADRARAPSRRLVPLVVDTDVEVVGYESILKDGAPVGQVTSGGYAHWAGHSLAMGYVAAEHAIDGAGFEIRIFEQIRPARIRLAPFFDANGGRQRG